MPSERTILFTDVEGSTALAHATGILWPAVLSTHGRLMVDAIDGHGGDIERTEGDSFMATFATAEAGVLAAITAQRAMASHRWPDPVGTLKVRMGLHTGMVEETDRYYVGVEIHRAARIGSAAHGGQILVSEATREALPESIACEEVGVHRLKDFPDPVPLFHVRYDGGLGVSAFPPPKTLGTGAALELLDRDDELERLNGAVQRLAKEKRGGALLIEGPPGIGKTSLVDAVVHRARSDALQVFRTRGSELESRLAFGAVRELLTAAVMQVPAAQRDDIFDGPAGLARAVLGFAAAEGETGDPLFGLFWLTVALAERQPIVLVVDDLHWLDEESARFVAYLAQRVEGLPILLLSSSRPAEPGGSDSVDVVAAESEVIRPRPLGPEAVGRLVKDRAAEDVLRVTGGNPLLAVELSRALAESSPGVTLDEIGPRSVGKAVLRRVSHVSTEAVALSRAVAISPDPLSLVDLAALANLSVEEARAAADALVRVDVLAHEAGRLTFVHPVMRTAVYEELDPFQRRQAHSAAAALLLEQGADLERIALHVLAGEPCGRSDYVSVLQAAADLSVERAAPRAACRYLERALVEPPAAHERAVISRQLGNLQAALGRPEAVESLRFAFETSDDPTDRVDIALELAQALTEADRPHDAITLLEGVGLDGATPEQQLDIDALTVMAAVDTMLEPGELEAYTARIPEELEGRTPAEQRALIMRSYALLIDDLDVTRAIELVRRVTGQADREAMRATDLVWCLRILSLLGYIDEADEIALDLSERAIRTGQEQIYAPAQFQFAVSANQRGDLRNCEALLRLGLEAPGLTEAYRVQIEDWLITTLSMQGRFEEAELVLQRQISRADNLSSTMLSRRRMELAMDRGDFPAALDHAVEAYDLQTGRVPALGAIGADYALVLTGVGRASEALPIAQGQLERALASDAAQNIGVARHALGVVLAALDDPSALEQLERAVAVLAASPFRWNQANAEVDLGRVLLDEGQTDRGCEFLMSALEYAVEHGAVPIEKRAREQLTRVGVTVLEPVAQGARLLSAIEERVAQLAASGLSDTEIAQRLFITTRSVQDHLAEAFAKLRIESREQLDEALAVTSVP